MNKIFKRILIILGGILAFILVAVIITAVVTGITLHNAEKTLGTSSELATEVSVKDLANNPENYDGKYVRVRGVFSYALENVAIYSSHEGYANSGKNHDKNGSKDLYCVWLDDIGLKSTFGVDLGDLAEYRGKSMVVEGYFNPLKTGHFNGYPGAIEKITYLSIEKGRKVYTFERDGLLYLLKYWFEFNFPSPRALWWILV